MNNLLGNIVSFLIGAIPFAVVVPWLIYRIDVRNYGSRNPGTTNVYRTLSQLKNKLTAAKITLLVGLLDLSKGVIPGVLFGNAPTNCLLAVVGHIYSPFLNWNGGKGVGTFLGAFFGATWNPSFLIPPIVWMSLTFNKKFLTMIGLDAEYVDLPMIKVKTSFLISFVCITLSMLLYILGSYPILNKVQFLIVYGVVISQHLEYIVFR